MSTDNLFDTEGPRFMHSRQDGSNCSVGIFGANYDGTTSYKPGTRFGPNAIRNVSQSLESYCPNLEKDLFDIKYFDAGSILFDLYETESIIKKVSLATEFMIKNNLKPLLLGGEHSITIGAIKALLKKYTNLLLIQLDAHADLRDTYQKNKFSHACTMRRCMDILPKGNIFQIGIRSGTRDEFKLMRETKQLIDFKTGYSAAQLKNFLQPFRNFPIYLTIDLDWFDPSLLPGTGTPEPGGFFWHDFEHLIKALNLHKVVGADIVELSPDIDNSGISSIVAAKVTRSLIMTLDNNHTDELT